MIGVLRPLAIPHYSTGVPALVGGGVEKANCLLLSISMAMVSLGRALNTSQSGLTPFSETRFT